MAFLLIPQKKLGLKLYLNVRKSFKNYTRKLREFLSITTQNRNTKIVRPAPISLTGSREGKTTHTEQILLEVRVLTRVGMLALILILITGKQIIFKREDTIKKVLGYLVMVQKDLHQEDHILLLVDQILGVEMVLLVHPTILDTWDLGTLIGRVVGTTVGLGEETRECLQVEQMIILGQITFKIEECLNFLKTGTFQTIGMIEDLQDTSKGVGMVAMVEGDGQLTTMEDQ